MRQITAIFLAIVITFANALCACATTRTIAKERVETRSCHASKSKKPCHSQERESHESGGSHNCAHCRNLASIASPTSASHTDLSVILVQFTLPLVHESFVLARSKLNSIDHTGLSPPHRPASTLLALSCSSNT
jgi:hypothetical protein